MPERLGVYTAQELLEAKKEGRRPVPEAVVDELPARFEARMEKPSREKEEVCDGRGL